MSPLSVPVRPKRATARRLPTPLELFARLKWIDGRPLLDTIEPYRRELFTRFGLRDALGRVDFNLVLSGRAKKNWKTTDLMLGGIYAVVVDSPGGNQGYVVANDEDQAGDDLELGKLLVRANPDTLGEWLVLKKNVIERKDGRGFLEILPAQDAVGAHGKTYRFLGIDEIHGYRNWDLLEALAPDPTRPDAQQWITSYASIFHKPGVPLFDLLHLAKAGTDPRMLFSWYAADFTTDPALQDATPEARANPSMESWGNAEYLAQQQRRLPSHKYRRLHLNLPGVPEGSAYQPEPIFEAITRGVRVRPREPGVTYSAFVDMSGGSLDDAVVAIAHEDASGRGVLDRLLNQGAPPPFDPRGAIERFVPVLKSYGCYTVVGDAYAGLTFRADFERHGINYELSNESKHELYEALEPHLNGGKVVLLDESTLEQQLLGLVWRGNKIDHPNGEHDDWSNGAAGALFQVLNGPPPLICQ